MTTWFLLTMKIKNPTICKINIIRAIVESYTAIANHNKGRGKNENSHLDEYVVQDLILGRLSPLLPINCFPDIIETNRKLKNVNENYIPDIIIKDITDNYWAIFELKTLFEKDNLSRKDIIKDLSKLHTYSEAHKNVLCCFVLVVDTSQQNIEYKVMPLSLSLESFSSDRQRPISIEKDKGKKFHAVPWMSAKTESAISIYLWRVCSEGEAYEAPTGDYHFSIGSTDISHDQFFRNLDPSKPK
ncbi:MAG: hypothetical protein ACYCQM_10960 [Acidithiobacillus sp.]